MRPTRLLLTLALTSAVFLCLRAVQAPDSARIYAQTGQPQQSIHWCTAQAGDDSAHIIGNACEVYSECLGAISLDYRIDALPFTGMSDTQAAWVRKCHQTLYDAARTNPQVKASKATQDWLTHAVYPGTEAKTFSVPDSLPPPR